MRATSPLRDSEPVQAIGVNVLTHLQTPHLTEEQMYAHVWNKGSILINPGMASCGSWFFHLLDL